MDFLVLDVIKFNLCKKYFALREIDVFAGLCVMACLCVCLCLETIVGLLALCVRVYFDGQACL